MSQTLVSKAQSQTHPRIFDDGWHWAKYSNDGKYELGTSRLDVRPRDNDIAKVEKRNGTFSYQRIGPLLAKQKTRLVFSNWGDVDVKKVVVKEIPRNASEAQIDLKAGQDKEYDAYLQEGLEQTFQRPVRVKVF